MTKIGGFAFQRSLVFAATFGLAVIFVAGCSNKGPGGPKAPIEEVTAESWEASLNRERDETLKNIETDKNRTAAQKTKDKENVMKIHEERLKAFRRELDKSN